MLWEYIEYVSIELWTMVKNVLYLTYFHRSRVDNNSRFIDDSIVEIPEVKPPGANFYPEDLTPQEFQNWVQTLSLEEQQKAKGYFWSIKREQNEKEIYFCLGIGNSLKIVPYSEEFNAELLQVKAVLQEAASLVSDSSLKRFVNQKMRIDF